jgi:hypothetical protein
VSQHDGVRCGLLQCFSFRRRSDSRSSTTPRSTDMSPSATIPLNTTIPLDTITLPVAPIPNVRRFGLEIIADVKHDEGDQPPINIVFIHGLGGASKDSWRHAESGSFWPLWLSQVRGLENARIMTFGYDSQWSKIWKPNNILDISDFAMQLVNDLWLHYTECGDVYETLSLSLTCYSPRQSSSVTAWEELL